jgi:hypothetical protein
MLEVKPMTDILRRERVGIFVLALAQFLYVASCVVGLLR